MKTSIQKASEKEMQDSFIQVAFQKDLNMINTFIFTLFCASLINATYTLITTITEKNLIISASLLVLAILMIVIKVGYLSFHSIAKLSREIDEANNVKASQSFISKITAI